MGDGDITCVVSSIGHVCNAHCGGELHASRIYSAARGPNEICALWDLMCSTLHQDTPSVCARWAEAPAFGEIHGWLVYWTEGKKVRDQRYCQVWSCKEGVGETPLCARHWNMLVAELHMVLDAQWVEQKATGEPSELLRMALLRLDYLESGE